MPTPITLGVTGGDYMDSATVIQWLVEVGEAVESGEPVVQVETAKARVDVPAPCAGILLAWTRAVGDDVSVGSVIGWIGEPGEVVPDAAPSEPPSKEDLRRDPVTTPTRPSTATPSARKLARELGVDLRRVRGTGPRGRIQNRDVVAAAEAPTVPVPPGDAASQYEIEPIAGYRRAMAVRMAASAGIPQFHVRRRVNAARFVAGRPQDTTVTALILASVAETLLAHPLLNCHWVDGELRRFAHVSLSVGVATDHGLVAPVVHHVDQLSRAEIASSLTDLIARAEAGVLDQADVAGGTFTVSNLGPFGVDEFAALVTPPQVGALAVGTLDGEGRLALTLSADHRVVDGVYAAGFLSTLAESIESSSS